VFGGLVAGLLPVLTGLATVTVAVALLGLVAREHTVSVFSLNVTSVLGLGLGIDYSLLVVNRFREELRRGESREEAVAATMGTAGIATVVSGGTVAIGFGALMLSHLNVLWSVGVGGALVVAVSVLASLTLIPALLAVFGSGVDRLALPFTRGHDTSGFWHALARRVMGRPLLFIGISLAVVVLIASPARNLRPGVVGAESLPARRSGSRNRSWASPDTRRPSWWRTAWTAPPPPPRWRHGCGPHPVGRRSPVWRTCHRPWRRST
jgi:putative drug exporter of the RND superfamily